MATATITAGQTVGFQWSLGNLVSASGGTHALTCFLVDNATMASKMAFPAGVSCQIPTSIVYPAGHTAASIADPGIYVAITGTLTASSIVPWSRSWRSVLGELRAALLIPLLAFRKKAGLGLKTGVLLSLLLLAFTMGVSGCGAGFNQTEMSTAAAAGMYCLRAEATPAGGGTTLTTAPFQVKVVVSN